MPATAIVTKLGAREVAKSREYILGQAKAIPEKFAVYQELQTLASNEKNPATKKILQSGANGVHLEYVAMSAEIATRIAEVTEVVSRDAIKFADFVNKFLPFFQTQQEMVEAKNQK